MTSPAVHNNTIQSPDSVKEISTTCSSAAWCIDVTSPAVPTSTVQSPVTVNEITTPCTLVNRCDVTCSTKLYNTICAELRKHALGTFEMMSNNSGTNHDIKGNIFLANSDLVVLFLPVKLKLVK